ncbi:MtrAB system accessory lipoprotein LpqB [soil metagenome]
MRSRTRSLAVLVVCGVLTLAGCVPLPRSGPVVQADVSTSVDDARASDFNPVPPRPDASRVEIVEGFLDAMTASPIRTDVAKQFLTESAAGEWDPDAATITYGDKLSPDDGGRVVVVPREDAESLDRGGVWEGRLPEAEQRLSFELDIEDGEYRITNPPDALVVPAPWFNQRFRQTSLYFFDVSGTILVPQPVFVPRGEQLASALITGLLAGPGPDLRNVSRSYLPPGLSLDLSVPISGTGVADITLVGEVGVQTPAVVERMLAQLAWTLRQEPGITALRVTIGDQVVQLPDGDSEYPVADAVTYDPNGDGSSSDLYALRDGILTVRDGNELLPLAGPFGVRNVDIRSAALNLDASEAAAVSADGTRVLLGPTGPGADTAPAALKTVFSGGDNLLTPAWDFAGRIWLVDRSPATGAVVRYVRDGRAHRLVVPGVSGRVVKSFLVSRDGTRFAAVVRGEDSDDLRVGRIEYSNRGQPELVAGTTSLLPDPTETVRIVDITWTSPTAIALLIPVISGEFFEVRTLTVDGAPTTSGTLSTTVSGALVGLAGSPLQSLPTYGVTESGLVDLVNEATYGFVGDRPSDIGYVG